MWYVVTTGRVGFDLEVDYETDCASDAKTHAKELKTDYGCFDAKVRSFESAEYAERWIDKAIYGDS